MHCRISSASQVYFGSLKGCYQCRCYCKERLYSQISLKVGQQMAFSLRLLLRCPIEWLAKFSVDPGILVSLYASTHCWYITVANNKWMIFWPNEDNPVEVGFIECSHHLVIQSSLHARLLPATLQWETRQGWVVFTNNHVQHSQAKAMYIYVHLVYLYWTSLNQSKTLLP